MFISQVAHMCSFIWRPEVDARCHDLPLSSCMLRQNPSPELRAHDWLASLASQLACPGVLCLCLPRAGVTGIWGCLSHLPCFYMKSKDQNSGSPICVTSPFSTAPRPSWGCKDPAHLVWSYAWPLLPSRPSQIFFPVLTQDLHSNLPPETLSWTIIDNEFL